MGEQDWLERGHGSGADLQPMIKGSTESGSERVSIRSVLRGTDVSPPRGLSRRRNKALVGWLLYCGTAVGGTAAAWTVRETLFPSLGAPTTRTVWEAPPAPAATGEDTTTTATAAPTTVVETTVTTTTTPTTVPASIAPIETPLATPPSAEAQPAPAGNQGGGGGPQTGTSLADPGGGDDPPVSAAPPASAAPETSASAPDSSVDDHQSGKGRGGSGGGGGSDTSNP